MAQGAKITSTDAVRLFKAAMIEYEARIRDTVTQLELDLHRVVDWIERDRQRYWTQEGRAASDAMAEARRALERVELAIRPEDKRSAYEKKLAFDRAKERVRTAEQKLRAVRKWRLAIHQEADVFSGHLNRLTNYLDTEFPRAVTTLERLAQALEKYTESAGAGEGGTG